MRDLVWLELSAKLQSLWEELYTKASASGFSVFFAGVSGVAAAVSVFVAVQALRPHHDFKLSIFDFSYAQNRVEMKLAFQNRGNQEEMVYRANLMSFHKGLLWTGPKRNSLKSFQLKPGAVFVKAFCDTIDPQTVVNLASPSGDMLLGLEVAVLGKDGFIVQHYPVALLNQGKRNEWGPYGNVGKRPVATFNLLSPSNIEYTGVGEGMGFVIEKECRSDSSGLP